MYVVKFFFWLGIGYIFFFMFFVRYFKDKNIIIFYKIKNKLVIKWYKNIDIFIMNFYEGFKENRVKYIFLKNIKMSFIGLFFL